MIGDKGCKELVKGQWDSLRKLDLSIKKYHKVKNCITDRGCQYWQKITGSSYDNWYYVRIVLSKGYSLITDKG